MDSIWLEIFNAFKFSCCITFISAILSVKILKSDIKNNTNDINYINVDHIKNRIIDIGENFNIFDVHCNLVENNLYIKYSYKNIMYLNNRQIQIEF